MFSRAALAVFALAVAEYFVFVFAAGVVGTSTVVWISIAAAVLGFVLIRRSVRSVITAGVQPIQQPRPVSAAGPRLDNADHGLLIAAGLLLVLPGLLTGAIGAALLLPPVRALVRARVRHRVDAVVSRGLRTPNGFKVSFADGAGFFARRDVVDVDLSPDSTSPDDTVDDDDPTTAPPELH